LHPGPDKKENPGFLLGILSPFPADFLENNFLWRARKIFLVRVPLVMSVTIWPAANADLSRMRSTAHYFLRAVADIPDYLPNLRLIGTLSF